MRIKCCQSNTGIIITSPFHRLIGQIDGLQDVFFSNIFRYFFEGDVRRHAECPQFIHDIEDTAGLIHPVEALGKEFMFVFYMIPAPFESLFVERAKDEAINLMILQKVHRIHEGITGHFAGFRIDFSDFDRIRVQIFQINDGNRTIPVNLIYPIYAGERKINVRNFHPPTQYTGIADEYRAAARIRHFFCYQFGNQFRAYTGCFS